MQASVEPDHHAPDPISTLRRLALLQGVSLGSLQSGRRDACRILIAAAARKARWQQRQAGVAEAAR